MNVAQMARYLTATKICTLVLVELYLTEPLESYSPSTSKALLTLISERISSSTGYGSGQAVDEVILPPANANEFASRLRGLPASIPGRSWFDEFTKALWLMDNLDNLYGLFERCDEVLPPITPSSDPAPTNENGHVIWKATRASLIGQFLRRCSVEFTRLQFEDSILLWNAFVSFRETTYEDVIKKLPEFRRPRSSMISAEGLTERGFLSGPASASTHSWPTVSPDDIEAMLAFAIHHLQKLGQRVPTELKTNIQQWLGEQKETGVQSLQHFMSFFESWRAGQYSMALENLHRYFDYSLASKGAGDNVRVYYQYALLHLSVLHADFERWDESVSAMEECISTARENQDTACLNFALSWLLYLRQAHGTKSSQSLSSLAALAGEGGNERDELAFLKAKARDSKHWSLVSSTLLEESKLEMRRTGVSPRPLEHALQAAHINLQYCSYSLMPASAVFQGGVWERLGTPHIASEMYHSIKPIYDHECSLGDQVRATCRIALSKARNGAYNLAIDSLKVLSLKVKGTLKLEQKVTVAAWIVEFIRQIRGEHFEAAKLFLSRLTTARSFTDPELVSQINLLEIELLIKRKRFDEALQKSNMLLRQLRSQPDADIAETVNLFVLKADVFAAAGKPTKGFSIALRAASTAERCRLYHVLSKALASLCTILNDLGEFQSSKALCEAVLPKALEMADTMLVSRLFYILLESYTGLAGKASDGMQTKHISAALAYADRAREAFGRIEDYTGQLDCLLIKAQLARFSGDEASAGLADAMYFQLMTDHDAVEENIR